MPLVPRTLWDSSRSPFSQPLRWLRSRPEDERVPPVGAVSDTSSASASEHDQSVLMGCRILVVDDNQDGADSLALMLEIIGATTSVAYDGESALRMLDAFDPHVMLLDWSLPGVTGDEVARIVREKRRDEVLLIAITGWGRDEDRVRSRQSGFDYHLVKPVEVRALQTLLTTDPRVCRSRR